MAQQEDHARPRPRLRRRDWAHAALRAIAAGGVGAVAVEPLAADLGATKGSFYWHFAGRDALVRAALELWEREHTEAVIDAMDAEDDPAERLRLLFRTITAHADADRVELALLADAADARVAPVLARVNERRVAYVADIYAELGLASPRARRRALLTYSAYLGHLQLMHATPAVLTGDPAVWDGYLEEALRVLL
jgi:AcrR family transcriptional regulator